MLKKKKIVNDFERSSQTYFQENYKIFIDNFGKKPHNIREYILSMGMSDSYELAIEEGANLVRVGSAIFGRRTYL